MSLIIYNYLNTMIKILILTLCSFYIGAAENFSLIIAYQSNAPSYVVLNVMGSNARLVCSLSNISNVVLDDAKKAVIIKKLGKLIKNDKIINGKDIKVAFTIGDNNYMYDDSFDSTGNIELYHELISDIGFNLEQKYKIPVRDGKDIDSPVEIIKSEVVWKRLMGNKDDSKVKVEFCYKSPEKNFARPKFYILNNGIEIVSGEIVENIWLRDSFYTASFGVDQRLLNGTHIMIESNCDVGYIDSLIMDIPYKDDTIYK
jgi:hypothetical protein